MDTLFIRHKLNTTPEILETLWRENLIAVHYINSESTDPAYYLEHGEKIAAAVLTRLHSCLKTGTVVAASFRDICPSELKIGRIEAGRSRIVARTFQHPNRDQLIYKVINLISTRDIDLRQYPVLMAIQPRGGTLTGWQSAAVLLEAILDGRDLPISLDSLHPSPLEVLCYEYLRREQEIRSLLIPIGRNMYEIDICGLGENGDVVLAQVTHSGHPSTTADKAERLAAFGGKGCRLFYFGPAGMKLTNKRLTYMPIEDVFEVMHKLEPQLVERMINPELVH